MRQRSIKNNFCPANWASEKEESATPVVWELCHDPESEDWEDWGGNDAIAWKTMKHAESLMAEVFGARYVQRVGLPWCAEKAIRNKYLWDEHPHPDDELAHVAEDAELLCLPL